MSSILTRDGKFLRTTDGKGLNFDSLITQANAKTGANDKTLGQAVQRLVDGYRAAGLPSDFQEVEYIEKSVANAYIDIDWAPTRGCGVRFKAMRTGGTYVTGGHIISVQQNVDSFWVAWRPEPHLSVRNFGNSKQLTFEESEYPQVIECFINSDSVNVDGVTIGEVPIGSDTRVSSLRLFNYASSSADYSFYGRLYYVEFIKNNTTICKFIPCYQKILGTIGVYDIIQRGFYPATGTFTKGPDVISPTDFMNNLEAIL